MKRQISILKAGEYTYCLEHGRQEVVKAVCVSRLIKGFNVYLTLACGAELKNGVQVDDHDHRPPRSVP